ncbi:hypothetical protein Tco_0873878 [Tanacetum coccineum]|uniref:Uncharacterized protein n=1 Tax=Tanacetum coccineum TaxID=301880 RepID=A0ABQ5BMW5_9ASTR
MNTSQSRRRTRVVLSDKEEVFEDPSKQGRSLIEELDLDAKISLVPPNDAEIQEKISNDTGVNALQKDYSTEKGLATLLLCNKLEWIKVRDGRLAFDKDLQYSKQTKELKCLEASSA